MLVSATAPLKTFFPISGQVIILHKGTNKTSDSCKAFAKQRKKKMNSEKKKMESNSVKSESSFSKSFGKRLILNLFSAGEKCNGQTCFRYVAFFS